MIPKNTRTLPLDDLEAPAPRRADHLYLVLDAARPRGGARHALVEIDEITIGRGATRRALRDDRQLRLECADPTMSSSHARLVRERAHWVVTDAGSRNGVLVNGVRQERAILLDGDLLELGRTFFILRESQPLPNGGGGGSRGGLDLALDLGADDGPVEPDRLVTLDPELGLRFDELRRVAAAPVPVLIAGPTGAGKERVARTVHLASGRRGAFVPVNCGALPAGLIESELFGHRRGAFSGAVDNHGGLVLASDGGTLFLDEIGDLPAPAQAALLRTLEEHEVRAVGATNSVSVDLRVVAATHRDLDELVEDGRFREDLHARLVGFALELPALAERRVDLGLMLGEIAPPGARLAAPAARALLRYGWPRNVRELVRVVERGLALAEGDELQLGHLPDEIAQAATAAPVTPPADGDERRAELVALLEKHAGNVSHVAAEMGRVRSQVQRWLKRYGLDPERYRR